MLKQLDFSVWRLAKWERGNVTVYSPKGEVCGFALTAALFAQSCIKLCAPCATHTSLLNVRLNSTILYVVTLQPGFGWKVTEVIFEWRGSASWNRGSDPAIVKVFPLWAIDTILLRQRDYYYSRCKLRPSECLLELDTCYTPQPPRPVYKFNYFIIFSKWGLKTRADVHLGLVGWVFAWQVSWAVLGM